MSIGLLGFASAQLTAKLLPRRDELADLKATVDRQSQLLVEVNSRLESVTGMLEQRSNAALPQKEAADGIIQLV